MLSAIASAASLHAGGVGPEVRVGGFVAVVVAELQGLDGVHRRQGGDPFCRGSLHMVEDALFQAGAIVDDKIRVLDDRCLLG